MYVRGSTEETTIMKTNRCLSGELRKTRRDFLAEGTACAEDLELKLLLAHRARGTECHS